MHTSRSHLTICVLVLMLVLVPFSQASAQSSYYLKNIETALSDRDLVSMISQVVVDGQYAYCVYYWGLEVVDISDPTAPIKLGECAAPDNKYSQVRTLSGDAIYYAGHLLVGDLLFDVSIPSAPVLVNEFYENWEQSALALSGEYLFAVWPNGQVRIFDFTNPRSPVLVQTWQTETALGAEEVVDAAISNGHLYLSTKTHVSMVIADISDPLAPTLVGTVPAPATGGILSAQGDFVAMIHSNYRPVEMFDMSDPASPVSLGQYDGSNYFRKAVIQGTRAYLIKGVGELEVVDFSSSQPPTLLSRRQPPTGNPYVGAWIDVLVANGMVIIARSDVGLELLDPSGDELTLIGQYQSHDYSKEVVSDGAYLYVASWRVGLRILGLTDPLHPELVATVPLPRVTSIAREGNAVYLGRRTDGIFNIVDVTDPLHPVMADSIIITGYVEDMVVNDGRLFVVDRYQGLRIYSLADPFAPLELGQITVGQGISVAVSGNVAVFGLDQSGGAYYVDVSDPSSPQIRGVFPPTVGPLGNLATDGRYAYSMYDGLNIYDMADPAHIVKVGSLGWYNMKETTGEAAGNSEGSLILSGNYLWVVNNNGLLVYDVRDRRKLKFAGSYGSGSYAGSGLLMGNQFYMAQEMGLSTLHWTYCCNGTTGDINMDGQTDLSDLSTEIAFILTRTTGSFVCELAMNVDSHGSTDLSDLSLLIAYMVGVVPDLPNCP